MVISVYCARWASQVSLVVKNPPANARDIGDISMEDPLGEGMATHSNILAWEISWTKESGGLQSMGPQRVGHDWRDLAHTLCAMPGIKLNTL